MKYSLVVLVVLIGLWIWRRGNRERGGESEVRPGRAAEKAPDQLMVRCKVCGVHLPRSEAIVSEQTVYCSESHRAKG